MFVLKGNDLAKVVKTQEGRLPSVPGKVNLLPGRSSDVLDDLPFQDILGHAELLTFWVEMLFFQVIAVVTAQVADEPNGLGENLKFTGSLAQGSAPDLPVEGHSDMRESSHV
jgi:hypothetical protein